MTCVIRSPQAALDLTAIWTCIAQDNPMAADKLIAAIDSTLSVLAMFPQCRPVATRLEAEHP
jgi:plasmid stabilization system protein ParE